MEISWSLLVAASCASRKRCSDFLRASSDLLFASTRSATFLVGSTTCPPNRSTPIPGCPGSPLVSALVAMTIIPCLFRLPRLHRRPHDLIRPALPSPSHDGNAINESMVHKPPHHRASPHTHADAAPEEPNPNAPGAEHVAH